MIQNHLKQAENWSTTNNVSARHGRSLDLESGARKARENLNIQKQAYGKSPDPAVSSAALKAPVVKAFLLDLVPSKIGADAGASAVFGV